MMYLKVKFFKYMAKWFTPDLDAFQLYKSWQSNRQVNTDLLLIYNFIEWLIFYVINYPARRHKLNLRLQNELQDAEAAMKDLSQKKRKARESFQRLIKLINELEMVQETFEPELKNGSNHG